jgi:hypothetical protein
VIQSEIESEGERKKEKARDTETVRESERARESVREIVRHNSARIRGRHAQGHLAVLIELFFRHGPATTSTHDERLHRRYACPVHVFHLNESVFLYIRMHVCILFVFMRKRYNHSFFYFHSSSCPIDEVRCVQVQLE